MIGAGTFINPLVKVITTVAILAAVYLFFVKPALDTTEEVARSSPFGQGGNDVQRQIQQSIREATGSGSGAIEIPNIDVQAPANAEDAQKLGACVSRAAPDVAKIQRCMERFAP